MAGVLVIGGLAAGGFDRSVVQAAAAAAPLAQALGVPLYGCLIGAGLHEAAAAFQCGLSRLWLADGPAYAPYNAPAYVAAARAAVAASGADIVVVAHGGAAREWVPTLAAGLDTGMVLNCCALAIEDGALIATKPINGGGVLARYVVLGAVRVVTVRAADFTPLEPGAPVTPEKLDVTLPLAPRMEVLGEDLASAAGPRLKDARRIVAGGRGVGGPQHWHHIEATAQLLDAAVGCSRPVADAGWVASAHQVGLSGTTVAPDLYLAVGISGAAQHLAGITAAKTVVAINTEVGAEIFKRADYGVVDDYVGVLAGFNARLQQLRAGGSE